MADPLDNKKGTLIKRMALLFFVFIIIPLAVIAIYAQYSFHKNAVPVIESTLITPYADALKEKDYEKAYQGFTSSEFQEAYSLDAYIDGWKKNTAEFGYLVDLSLIKNNAFKSGGGNLFTWKTTYEVHFSYTCQNKGVWVCWIITSENGSWKIDSTHQVVADSLFARIF